MSKKETSRLSREANRKASSNAMYMTVFIVLVVLIFTVPVASYIALAHHNQTANNTPTTTKKVVKHSKAPQSSKDESASSASFQESSVEDDMSPTMSSASSVDETPQQSMSVSSEQSTETYTVQAKDNLYRIALRFGMTQQELMQLNGMTTPSVSVGQVLKVK